MFIFFCLFLESGQLTLRPKCHKTRRRPVKKRELNRSNAGNRSNQTNRSNRLICWTNWKWIDKTRGMPISPTSGAASRSERGLGWRRLVPGLSVLSEYRGEWLAGDVLAGVSVCVVMIPSVIAYAGRMGLAPQHGLYAALVPLLIYPLIGSSRQVIVGPDIAISLLIASTIAPMAAGNAIGLGMLAAMIAVLSGLLLLLAAWARLGAIADFLSKPVLVGYMTGAALILVASQLNKLFGVNLRTSDFFPRCVELVSKLGQTHLPSLMLGLGCLGILLALRRLAPKVPGALVVCAGAILLSRALDLQHKGVAVVGSFPRGLP